MSFYIYRPEALPLRNIFNRLLFPLAWFVPCPNTNNLSKMMMLPFGANENNEWTLKLLAIFANLCASAMSGNGRYDYVAWCLAKTQFAQPPIGVSPGIRGSETGEIKIFVFRILPFNLLCDVIRALRPIFAPITLATSVVQPAGPPHS